MRDLIIRDSEDADIPSVRAIYAYYVLESLASLEEEPPSVDELQRRRSEVLSRGLPHIVAEFEGQVVGYSYAVPYRSRSAYRFTVENSVYVKNGLAGRGIGKALLSMLITRCEGAGLRQMVAIIGGGNVPSVRLHEYFGFTPVGTLRDVGVKFGRSVDVMILQRRLVGT